MILALVIGTLLAVGALAFVLYPIFFGVTKQAPIVVCFVVVHVHACAVDALAQTVSRSVQNLCTVPRLVYHG